MDKREAVVKALSDETAMPAAPLVVTRIAEICRNPSASARDLGKAIQLDPALTSRVLRQVNSSFYGLAATIKTVTHAVVILGFQEIKHIALSVPVANLYHDNFGRAGIDVAALWERTVAVACLARRLSYHVHHEVPEQVFVSAILADMGMVILNRILGEEYLSLTAGVDDEDLANKEQSALGISHIEVGMRLAAKWQFPPDLVQAIALHHHPFIANGLHRESALTYAGRRALAVLAAGLGFGEAIAAFPPALADFLGLSAEELGAMWEKSCRDLQEAKTSLAG